MKLLVIGSGGREHAIAWKLAQSKDVTAVCVAPGNAGTFLEPKMHNIPIDPLDFAELSNFVKTREIDFTIVGPEAPLSAGIVDYFRAQNLPCLGPTQFCAQLESSKVFSKNFMRKYGIPTAQSQTFSDAKPAKAYLTNCTFPQVIKADGLAAGKGVIIAQDLAEGVLAVEQMLNEQRFGEAARQILIEEFIEGEEISFIVLSDGKNFIALPSSQDHKRRDDGDKGPNTGGMGAYSPAPLATPILQDRIITQVIVPALEGMAKEGHLYQGFLYAGLMITPEQDIKVLEFNCRLGDPETQPILMRLQSDFTQMCAAAIAGKLNEYSVKWDERPALGVVLAAKGYPDEYNKGYVIPKEMTLDPEIKIFHAGTQMADSQIVTNGGRVLCVTALGDNLAAAQQRAYSFIRQITWDGLFYRTDIGHRALKK